ncbi:hypothetical protein TI05_06900, partial [Achromatium sp. WMS3]
SRTAEDFIHVLKSLVEWLQDPAQSHIQRSFLTWMHRVGPKKIDTTDITEIHDLQEMYTMLAERINKIWPEQWRQQGIQQGERQAERRLLRNMLQHRFGPQLPAWVDQHLQKASIAQLEKWGLAFVTAQTLQDIFDDHCNE